MTRFRLEMTIRVTTRLLPRKAQICRSLTLSSDHALLVGKPESDL
jgi:hypothetical protein